MSMTNQEYLDWCNGVSNTNKAQAELDEIQENNRKWMGKHLREFFEDLGEVLSIRMSADVSVIKVRMNKDCKLDADAFASLPFQFNVEVNEDCDLTFILIPDVEVYNKK